MGLFSRRLSKRRSTRRAARVEPRPAVEPAYLDWIDIYTVPRDGSSAVPPATWVLRDAYPASVTGGEPVRRVS